jgi:acetyl-CoA C-acetyltransferase
MSSSPERIPVIVGVGQAINRDEVVTSRDLMERAARVALDEATGLADRLDRVTSVAVLNDDHPRPATAVARRLGLRDVECETTTVGGSTPQWLLTRTAGDVADGEIGAALLVGSEALASVKQGCAEPDPDAGLVEGPADPVVGVERFGLGPAETGIRLYLPIHIYPLFESAMAAAAGRSFEEQRWFIARFMSRNASVAAGHPYAWFPEEATPEELSAVTDRNRLIADPYTLRLNPIMAVDQGAALVVCSLAVAREAGLEDQAVFIWSGAEASDVWYPSQRPELARSPGIRAAGEAALGAAGIGIDDVDHVDLYSCFPSAIQAGAAALGVALDDPRGLTVTGGLAYFGGPGNNYPMHSVATTVDRLRGGGGFGLCTGLSWYTTKHCIGVYGAEPPPHGFRRGDSADAQAAIDATEIPVVLDAAGPATVVASTVTYERDGRPTDAPVFADLPDGRRVAARAADGLAEGLAGVSLVGARIRLSGTEPLTYGLEADGS